MLKRLDFSPPPKTGWKRVEGKVDCFPKSLTLILGLSKIESLRPQLRTGQKQAVWANNFPGPALPFPQLCSGSLRKLRTNTVQARTVAVPVLWWFVFLPRTELESFLLVSSTYRAATTLDFTELSRREINGRP
jgi:hypothetical protein